MQKKRHNLYQKAGRGCLLCIVFGLLTAVTQLAGCERKSSSLVISAAEEAASETARPEDAKLPENGSQAEAVPETAGTETPVSVIAVHVCGAVTTDGVYELAAGARVKDAVAAAGGFSPDADRSFVNQAAYLTDGMRLKIPTAEETASLAEGATGSLLSDELVPEAVTVMQTENMTHLVNINTATAAELCTLNGVGEARAAEIIRHRETHGAFTRIEDLMQVTGIKEKLFEKIRDAITV